MGIAAADILFGKVNPSGRLPITFYDSNNDLPAFEDHSMQNRTYRYIAKQPKFNFGFGLSYTQFSNSNARIEFFGKNVYDIKLEVKNIGKENGDAVVQLYAKHKNAKAYEPKIALKYFAKVSLNVNEKVRFLIAINRLELNNFDEALNKNVEYSFKDYDFYVTVNGKDFVQVEFKN